MICVLEAKEVHVQRLMDLGLGFDVMVFEHKTCKRRQTADEPAQDRHISYGANGCMIHCAS